MSDGSRALDLPTLLAAHGLIDTPGEIADALASAVRRAQSTRPRPVVTLGSRERAQALSCAQALLRYQTRRPRNPETPAKKRQALLDLLGSLPIVAAIAAATGQNIGAPLSRIRDCAAGIDDLEAVTTALKAYSARQRTRIGAEKGIGAGRPAAAYLPLLRAAELAWQAAGRVQRYTASASAPFTLSGPLPAFIRNLIDLAGIQQPNDPALHRQLTSTPHLLEDFQEERRRLGVQNL